MADRLDTAPGDAASFIQRAACAPGAQFAALSSIFDAAEIVLYVADMQTHELLFMNRHAEQLWGRDWAGKRCYSVLQRNQAGPCSFCTNAQLIEGGLAAAPVVWEFQNTANGRWYHCIDKAIEWVDGRLVRMEVAIDMTHRKEADAFREQYLGLVSHDLRVPLSSITVATTMLKRVLEEHGLPDSVHHADVILRSAGRMSQMIDELVETTRLEAGQLQLRRSLFDLDGLVSTVVAQRAADAGRPIELEAQGRAPVLADAALVERVLNNLIDNALRYSEPQMPVTVRVAPREQGTDVTVSDRGVGVPPDELPRLFQRFYRSSRTRSTVGTGLGLYSSRLIIENHGGRIWAEGNAVGGSTFGFSLPLHRAGS